MRKELKGKKMLRPIGDIAENLLYDIAKKRVARTLATLELANCSEQVKTEIKRQIWEFKNDVERKVLGKESNYDNKKENSV